MTCMIKRGREFATFKTENAQQAIKSHGTKRFDKDNTKKSNKKRKRQFKK